ncbi:MAG: hypothetical protein HC809_15600, partial [Gammaproteobacteria bacterium]|nr:hypothetical protein [Gammaproteobacteria bacterium]
MTQNLIVRGRAGATVRIADRPARTTSTVSGGRAWVLICAVLSVWVTAFAGTPIDAGPAFAT